MSALALLLDTGIYLTISKSGVLEPQTASAFGYTCGLIFAYIYMKKFVFVDAKNERNKKSEILLFAVSGLVGICVTYITVYAWVGFVNDSLYLAKLFAVVLSFASVYVFRRAIVFPVV